MTLPLRLLTGLLFSALVAGLAYRRHALAPSGVAGAILVGTLIWWLGGPAWGLTLITFFVLSSLLSYYKATVKAGLAEKFSKGSRRDLGQTLANGGAGALLAIAYALHPHSLLLVAFVGALATVNADTWATELGVLSRRPPRLITTGKVVEVGTSGGVSLQGTLATLAGGLIIGLAALGWLRLEPWLGGSGGGDWRLLLVGALGGLGGSLADSLLGATVQAIYYSSVRHKETEKRIDPDGTPNTLLRGWRWLDNDWVNFLSSCVGALLGALVAWVLA